MSLELKDYFLPYQKAWLADQSRFKVWEKSRRVGATYVQSFEDVRYCAERPRQKVYFSSADETAAKEYIDYSQQWCEVYNIVASVSGDVIVDLEHDINATSVTLLNGSRIFAMSSSPRRFRSKGGKVVLDEFAFHDNPKALWDAARPCIMWGAPLRIMSTYNGSSNLYYRFVDDIKAKKLPWNLHTTSIITAVDQGLADRITRSKLTEEQRAAWLAEERANSRDETTWQQEYCCVPMDESVAFLPYDLIGHCEREYDYGDLSTVSGELFVGMDIGRSHDLTVIWVLEELGTARITRAVIVMEKAPFHAQRDTLFGVLNHPKLHRACIDATGLGMQLAEESAREFGEYRVEQVTFTQRVKEEIAFGTRRAFDNREVVIPSEAAIREDLHNIRKTMTAAGNIRIDSGRDDRGHSDRFWALSLALHAASTDQYVPLNVTSRQGYTMPGIVRGY